MIHNLPQTPNPGAVADLLPEAVAVEEQRLDFGPSGSNNVRMILITHVDCLGAAHSGTLQSGEEYRRMRFLCINFE